MIDIVSFKTPDNLSMTEAVLRLLRDTFGKEEEQLERRQLYGCESGYNEDFLFTAWEDGKLFGNLHLTTNFLNKAFGCLGGLVTVPEARGRGIATKLFENACQAFDKRGGKALFLGTANPTAARMYEKFGFRFISGTAIMVRVNGSSLYDFCKEIYSEKECVITEMDDGCRVPIIPLAASRGRDVLMDANANIINNLYATQNSCTGLYPRFLKIKDGGAVKVAKLKNQAIAAVLTDKYVDSVHRLDCFAHVGFEHVLPEMVESSIKSDESYSAIVCKQDTEKLKLFCKLGFVINRDYDYSFNSIHLPCYLLQR